MHTSRQLAAILFADIVGYTAMMQRNEEEGLAKVRHFSDVIKLQVNHHEGEVLQFMGDGCLCIFQSAVQAMHAARKIQQDLKTEPEVPLRIGIHLGDIVLKEGNIYGDGVNIASRVESMGVPGSVLVSDRVIPDLKNHPEFELISLGEFHFKNVAQPMEIFALANDGLIIPKKNEIKGKLVPAPSSSRGRKLIWSGIMILALSVLLYSVWDSPKTEKVTRASENTIAVMDFEYISSNEKYAYLAKGFPSAIVEQLSFLDNVKISPHSSVEYYLNQGLPVNDVADKLQVHFFLEGLVQEVNDEIQIRIRLIDVVNDQVSWSQSFPFSIDDFFNIQNQISKNVASVLVGHLTDPEFEKLNSSHTTSKEVYNLYQKGVFFMEKTNTADLFTAIDFFQEAYRLDPGYAQAYTKEALCYTWMSGYMGGFSPKAAFDKVIPLLEKSISIDPYLSETYNAYGLAFWWLDWNCEKAFDAFEKAVEVNPKEIPDGQIVLFTQNGLYKESLDLANRLFREEPLIPSSYHAKGVNHFLLGEEQEALDIFEEGLKLFPDHSDLHWEAGRVQMNLGKVELGMKTLRKGIELSGFQPPNMLAYLAIGLLKTGQKDQALQILRELETRNQNNEHGLAFFIAHIYCALGDFDTTFEWLEIAYKDHELEMIWLKVEPQFRPIHGDERFQALLDKVGFFSPNPTIHD